MTNFFAEGFAKHIWGTWRKEKNVPQDQMDTNEYQTCLTPLTLKMEHIDESSTIIHKIKIMLYSFYIDNYCTLL